MKQGKFNIIIGAQAGNEAKGKLSVFLVEKFKVNHLVMAASPDASHTAYEWSGKKCVSRHIPVGAIGNPASSIYLGPSSVIMPEVFLQELVELGIDQARIFINPRATILSYNQTVHIVRAGKLIYREDVIFADSIPELKSMIDDTVWMVNDLLQKGVTILCEMTQGFDVDLEHGVDLESCTSKMVNPAMAMAEAGVSPKWLGDIYGVLRPFPAIPRQNSEFYWGRFEQFCRVCCPDFLCLQFANHLYEGDYGRSGNWIGLSKATRNYIERLEKVTVAKVAYVGTGPDRGHMIDVGVDEQQ